MSLVPAECLIYKGLAKVTRLYSPGGDCRGFYVRHMENDEELVLVENGELVSVIDTMDKKVRLHPIQYLSWFEGGADHIDEYLQDGRIFLYHTYRDGVYLYNGEFTIFKDGKPNAAFH